MKSTSARPNEMRATESPDSGASGSLMPARLRPMDNRATRELEKIRAAMAQGRANLALGWACDLRTYVEGFCDEVEALRQLALAQRDAR